MYKAALIGTGKIAGLFETPSKVGGINSHAKAIYNNLKISLDCLVNPNKKDLLAFNKKWKVKNTFTDLEVFLNSNKYNIITICSPDATHFKIASEILKSSSKPDILFIEKPYCRNVSELNTIAKLVKNSGTLVVVNHKRRFDISHRKLKKLIESGLLGEPLGGSFTYYGGWLHNGVHLLDLIIFLFGKGFKSKHIEMKKYGPVNDKCLETELHFKSFKINLSSIDEKYFQLFEGELRFTKGRVLYRDFGNEIIVEKVKKNKLNELELKPLKVNGIKGLNSPLTESYNLFVQYLKGKSSKNLEEVNLNNIEIVMKKLFSIQKAYGS